MFIILKPLLLIIIAKHVLLNSVFTNIKTLYNIAFFLKNKKIKFYKVIIT
jgi:hypothetical protein